MINQNRLHNLDRSNNVLDALFSNNNSALSIMNPLVIQRWRGSDKSCRRGKGIDRVEKHGGWIVEKE